ncbi:rRNA adenine N-6-methyltransferase family protein [Sphingomonas sp. AOB5]|uniref:protein-L-isoaspartate O-methyltransferase family protein n=1 Tax=Sphingomonas sp. AOB5 TaxID=3034017 RepID=UPI0023F84302|nr:rRNA adenine N-6-methyltransferase family protein [Sphingomonas sp. AOB5]MDF7775507.1 rRNA adenine N-6-methyltransferase family protein [Sphingomonas sp. AOB5]
MMTPMVDPAHSMRHSMVASQLRTNSVSDVRVVEAMAKLPREDFVPAEHREIAYRDTLLPLGGGRRQNSPLATGRLLTEAQIRSTDNVLLIGAAGGYAAAVLAEMAANVVALEEDADLLAIARTALAGAANVTIVEGPLAQGWAKADPYDVIVVDGAAGHIPDTLIAQLKDGGRIATGIEDRGITRLATGRKTGGGFGLTEFADIECAVLPGFAKPRTFQF